MAKTVDSRLRGMAKRRKKICLSCDQIFRTTELPEIEGQVPGFTIARAALDCVERVAQALEIERRKLDWIERIAQAMEVERRNLLALLPPPALPGKPEEKLPDG
jgi:transcriptional regulator NrdR family protein